LSRALGAPVPEEKAPRPHNGEKVGVRNFLAGDLSPNHHKEMRDALDQ